MSIAIMYANDELLSQAVAQSMWWCMDMDSSFWTGVP